MPLVNYDANFVNISYLIKILIEDVLYLKCANAKHLKLDVNANMRFFPCRFPRMKRKGVLMETNAVNQSKRNITF